MARRAMVLLVWVLSTALAAGVAWTAVAAVGRGPGAGDRVLSEAQVAAALDARQAAAASASPTASPTWGPTTSPDPSASPDPTATPTTPTADPTTPTPTAPELVVRTWPVEGGAVSASCTGTVIALEYASANDGWAYEVKNRGPEQVEVELATDGAETKVRAVCVAGVPEMTVETGASHDGGDAGDGGGGGADGRGDD